MYVAADNLLKFEVKDSFNRVLNSYDTLFKVIFVMQLL